MQKIKFLYVILKKNGSIDTSTSLSCRSNSLWPLKSTISLSVALENNAPENNPFSDENVPPIKYTVEKNSVL